MPLSFIMIEPSLSIMNGALSPENAERRIVIAAKKTKRNTAGHPFLFGQ